MNPVPLRSLALVIAILFCAGSLTAETEERWTFDGEIHNNSLALSPDERTIVVSYSKQPELVVYDVPQGKVRKVLDGWVTPRNIAFSPSGDAFFVSDSSLGVVRKIDSGSLETLAEYPVGPGVFGTTISADGSRLYATNQAANTVTIIDLKSGRPVKVITGFAGPRQGIRLSHDGETLYVTNFKGDKITIIDTETLQPKGEIIGFNKLRAISISDDDKTLFAANSGSDKIAVVDLESGKITEEIPVGKEPYGAALAPGGKRLYSGDTGGDTLTIVDLASRKPVGTITGFSEPRQAIVFTKDGAKAFVLNKDLSVAVVDLTKNQIMKSLKTEGT